MQTTPPAPRSKSDGLQSQALQNSTLIRDTRTLYERAIDTLTNPINNSMAQLFVIVVAFASSFLLWFAPFFLLGLQGIVNSRKAVILAAPYRLPRHKNPKQTDYNHPIPGTGDKKFFKALGSIFLGNCKTTGKQCWVSQQDLLTHSLILGTTGSGKTETLVGYVANILSRGSGVIYVDAKAAPKLYVQIATIARRMGREDDLLVINYLTGNKQVLRDVGDGRKADKLSNTNNPFATGSADSIIQLLKAFLPSDSGANSIFSDKAEAFMQALIYALCDLRDFGGVELGAGVIFQYMELDMIHELVLDKSGALTKKSKEGLVNYLRAGISYDLEKSAADQNDAVTDQHGYAKSYYAKTLSSLKDVYSHVYMTIGGEVDFTDVVLNNRILVVLLPSLEKSEPELSTLAKLNLYGLKNALSPGLGSALEGNTDSVLHNLPSGSGRTMTLNINDEYGYMSVKGFAVVAAQARGLGLGSVFAGQDFQGFRRGDAGEADQIWANTRLKFFGALEDIETLDKIIKMFPAVKVGSARGYGVKQGLNLSGQYNENANIDIVDVARVEPEDLLRQIEGEMHCSLKGKLERLEAFYADPPIESVFSKEFGDRTLFVNQFIFISAVVKDYIKDRGERRDAESSASETSSGSPTSPELKTKISTTPAIVSSDSVESPPDKEKQQEEMKKQMLKALADGASAQQPRVVESEVSEVEPPRVGVEGVEPILSQSNKPLPEDDNGHEVDQAIAASAQGNGENGSDDLLIYNPKNIVGYVDAKNHTVPKNVGMKPEELDNMLANL